MLLFCGREVRGALAGNGGKMAAVQQELGKGKTNKRTSSATKNGIRDRANRTRERAGGKAARKDGAERLRWAADRQVGRNSAKLADVLTDKALKGDLASTKVLLALAEGKKPIEEVKKLVRSLALRLATEPQWEWPLEGKEGIGNRE